jgi:hypothetical protein
LYIFSGLVSKVWMEGRGWRRCSDGYCRQGAAAVSACYKRGRYCCSRRRSTRKRPLLFSLSRCVCFSFHSFVPFFCFVHSSEYIATLCESRSTRATHVRYNRFANERTNEKKKGAGGSSSKQHQGVVPHGL